MKIGRFTDSDGEFWGVVDDARGVVRRIEGTFEQWAPAVSARPGSAPPLSGAEAALEGLTTLTPVPDKATVVAMGLTYATHAKGVGGKMPREPSATLKTYGTLTPHLADIRYPQIITQLDYEAELVVVIGAREIPSGSDPATAFLGYTVGNDVTARNLQYRDGGGMDLFSAKAIDGTSGLGPWIVTRDEFGEGHPDLAIELDVDGEIRQRDRTSSMAWSAAELVAYVNERTCLRSGAALFTGTPAGVGHEDGRYLEPGQTVSVTIEGIGTLKNRVGEREKDA